MNRAQSSVNRVFLQKLQRFTAEAMISGSALRNVGAANVVQCARDYLSSLTISGMDRFTRFDYLLWLNKNTKRLRDKFPGGAQKWGPARKAMNIFMRSVVYTSPLADEYGLWNLLPYLEVPLDSYTGKALADEPEGAGLPKWKSVVGLTPDLSNEYQGAALRVARRMGVHRADLDVYYWRPPKT
jgi:hypothetical protein